MSKQLVPHKFWSRGAFKLCKYIEIYDRLLFLMVSQHFGNITDISAEILIGLVCGVPSRRLRFVYMMIHNNKGWDLEISQGIWMTRSPTAKAALNISAKTFLKTVKSLARHKRLKKTVPLISLSVVFFKQYPLKMHGFFVKHLHRNKKINYVFFKTEKKSSQWVPTH